MKEKRSAKKKVAGDRLKVSRPAGAKTKKAPKRPHTRHVHRPAKRYKPHEMEPVAMEKVVLPKELQPVTMEEIIELKETEQQYHSNLLCMQINELLQEIKLKDKKRKTIDDFLQRISSCIEKIPPSSTLDVTDKSMFHGSVKIPILLFPDKGGKKFSYLPPSSIKVVGSYLLGTCIKPEINVDVAVTMPEEMMNAKDYLNQRYLRKRALYLAYITARLAKKKFIGSLRFTYMNGDHLKPVLLLRPRGNDEKMVTVRIHVCPPSGVFRYSRFSPSQNNVQRAWYQEEGAPKAAEGNEPPTPHYNNSVLCDLTLEPHFHHLSSSMCDFPGMKDAISILKVWLRQRQLDKGSGSFSGFVGSMLISHLLSKNKINKVMTAENVFRNTLLFLANTDWTVKGITMSRSPDPSLPSLADFHQAFEVVFVDPLGVVNLCADMTAATYRRIQFEAKESLKILSNTNTSSFLQLLMVPKPFQKTFDHVCHITELPALLKTCKKLKLCDELMDRGGDYVLTSLRYIMSVLQKGLEPRVVLLSHALPQKPEWDINQDPANHSDADSLLLGLMLTIDFFTSPLQKGPAADSPEAVGFRSFWGEKSELRRFKDASICEAVVWPVNNIEEKRRIPELIIRHLLQLHADIPDSAITCTGNLLDCVLNRGKKSGTGEESIASVIQSYDDLSRKLWTLADMPLAITSVQGTHPALRCTDVFPPVPVTPSFYFFKRCESSDEFLVPLAHKPTPAYVSPVRVICHLEGSGKWPSDKRAIRKLKAAFHIRLAELLKEQHGLMCRVTPGHVDVYKDGYVFRVQVAYHREAAFIREVIAEDGMRMSMDSEKAFQLELETIHLPYLTSTLHGLHQRFPALGVTSRIAKRWISAHLLADSISDECVDLLVAHLFLQPEPFTAPSSPQLGFFRFLSLLVSHDWKNSPIIVNFNEDLKDADITEIQNRFTSTRNQLPVIFIATPKDRDMSVWTMGKPSAQILHRLIILASESLVTLEKQLMSPSEISDIKIIFRPPMDVYDVLIHLNPRHIPRHREAVDQPTISFIRGIVDDNSPKKDPRFPVVDYDPVQLYLCELRACYGEFALFFYDTHGGEVIGVLWNPSSFTPQPFNKDAVNGRVVDTKSETMLLVPSVEAMLADFEILGKGLVSRIQCQSEKWKI